MQRLQRLSINEAYTLLNQTNRGYDNPANITMEEIEILSDDGSTVLINNLTPFFLNRNRFLNFKNNLRVSSSSRSVSPVLRRSPSPPVRRRRGRPRGSRTGGRSSSPPVRRGRGRPRGSCRSPSPPARRGRGRPRGTGRRKPRLSMRSK